MAELTGEQMVDFAADAVASGDKDRVIETLKTLRFEIQQRSLKRKHPALNYRQYAASRPSRLTLWGASNTSADSELTSSLVGLRTRSRQLVRDTSYAKRARKLVIDNVVGTGIGLQAQVESSRGVLRKSTNDDIEAAWSLWARAESCHTGGSLCFADLERLAMGEVMEAGEVFIRKHYRPFGSSAIPFALEVIEGERLAEDIGGAPNLAAQNGNELRMGVEVDQFGRPVAYHIKKRFPSEIAYGPAITDYVERVPAEQVIHLRIIDRWPQTRGVPWLDAAAVTLANMAGYVDAEITKARVQALTVGAIETPQSSSGFSTEQPNEDGSVEMELQAGTLARLNPGEAFKPGPSGSPNPALDPFMRYMIREIAVSIPGVSYEELSGDFSQSNYSSSRQGILTSRDAWRVLQQWFIRTFREPIHREWMQQAVISGAVAIPADQFFLDMQKWTVARFKPRGWSWVDPTTEVTAYKEAVLAGFTTVDDVIAQTANGDDIEDVLQRRKHELDMMDEADLTFDTSPDVYAPEPTPAPQTAAPEPVTPQGRVVTLR